ncbi:MAG TPA: hypothetical protein VEV37_07605 [Bryobacteraceae bacterium]|nr:hypothetical protein [Bryobacteraceae bacterium]
MRWKTASLISLAVLALSGAEKYTGPVPPKPDIPYLLHASNLIETETGQARSEKNNYVISGSASPVRTPLAEPIFIMEARDISPERLELARLEVKGGNREVSLGGGRRRGGGRLHLAITSLGGHLYKIEVDEPLENGEYALSPNGDNRVFCFEIY